MNNKIYLPNCGIYNDLLIGFFKKTTNMEVINIKRTNDILTLGNRYSPINMPIDFKYKLGQLIVAINNGCTYLLDLETGYLKKYYYLLQIEILEHLGYTFNIIKLTNNRYLTVKKIYDFIKITNPKINIIKFICYYLKLLIEIYIIKKQSKQKNNKHFKNIKKQTN